MQTGSLLIKIEVMVHANVTFSHSNEVKVNAKKKLDLFSPEISNDICKLGLSS